MPAETTDSDPATRETRRSLTGKDKGLGLRWAWEGAEQGSRKEGSREDGETFLRQAPGSCLAFSPPA